MRVYKFSETKDKPYWAGLVTAEEIQRLKDNQVTLRDVVSRDGYLYHASKALADFTTPGRIPQDDLPEAGTFLYYTG